MQDIIEMMETAKESAEVSEKINEMLMGKEDSLKIAILGATTFEILMNMDYDERMKNCCDMTTTMLELIMKGR